MNVESKQESSFDLIRYCILAGIIVFVFRIFVAQPYLVEGASSYPTFKNGDYLIVEQISKRFEEPKRQDFLIIRYPKDRTKYFIKRLIGFPGEKISIVGGEVFVQKKESGGWGEPQKLNEPYVVYSKIENLDFELGNDEFFVMGDNRAGSSDSRVWGPILKSDIVGRPFVRLWPLDKIGVWPGFVRE